MAARGLILLAEDEDGVRAIAADLLRRHGYDVLEAADGLEALAIIQARGTQIGRVICDAVMPDLDAPELVRRAAQWIPADRFFVRSGCDNRARG